MFLLRFNFPEEKFARIGHKVAKTCSIENFFHRNILFVTYVIGIYLRNARSMLGKREKKAG